LLASLSSGAYMSLKWLKLFLCKDPTDFVPSWVVSLEGNRVLPWLASLEVTLDLAITFFICVSIKSQLFL